MFDGVSDLSQYVALHTDDPSAFSLQSTYEACYNGYSRVRLAAFGKTMGFGMKTGGSDQLITHYSIGSAGIIFSCAPMKPNIFVTNYVSPLLTFS